MRRLALLALLAAAPAAWTASGGPGPWATPLEAAGLPNLFRVDGGMYRSGQFDRRGLESIRALGVRTVVCLRADADDADLLGGRPWSAWGIERYERIPLRTWWVRGRDMDRFIRLACDPATPRPMLVHCRQGSDRTGAAVALYRVAALGWTPAEALDEMLHGGFGFHSTWQNLAWRVRQADPARLAALCARPSSLPPTH